MNMKEGLKTSLVFGPTFEATGQILKHPHDVLEMAERSLLVSAIVFAGCNVINYILEPAYQKVKNDIRARVSPTITPKEPR